MIAFVRPSVPHEEVKIHLCRRCNRGSAIRQPRSCETLTFARISFFCGRPAKKKIFLREPGGGPPTVIDIANSFTLLRLSRYRYTPVEMVVSMSPSGGGTPSLGRSEQCMASRDNDEQLPSRMGPPQTSFHCCYLLGTYQCNIILSEQYSLGRTYTGVK